MREITIYDSQNNAVKCAIPEKKIARIVVVLFMHCEAICVVFEDGTEQRFDSRASRSADVFKGAYAVEGEDIEKWLSFVPEGKMSYPNQRMAAFKSEYHEGGKNMEERIVREVRIYKLILNNMHDRAGGWEIVAVSGNYEDLVNWYNEQKAPEMYRDGRWGKTFKQGSPLEWFNPTGLELNETRPFGHGISDEWVRERTWQEICESGWFLVIGER